MTPDELGKFLDEIGRFIGNYGFPIVALIGVGWFVNRVFMRIFSYVTKEYFPARIAIENAKNEVENLQAKTLARIEALLTQNQATIHDVHKLTVETNGILKTHVAATEPAIKSIFAMQIEIEALKQQSVIRIADEVAKRLKETS